MPSTLRALVSESVLLFGHDVETQMGMLPCLGKYGISCFTQRIEALDDCVKHYDSMLLGIEALDVLFTAFFTADFENF